MEEKNKEINEYTNKMGKMKNELNGFIRENILIKNEIDIKSKEIDYLNNKLMNHKNKFNNKNINYIEDF